MIGAYSWISIATRMGLFSGDMADSRLAAWSAGRLRIDLGQLAIPGLRAMPAEHVVTRSRTHPLAARRLIQLPLYCARKLRRFAWRYQRASGVSQQLRHIPHSGRYNRQSGGHGLQDRDR